VPYDVAISEEAVRCLIDVRAGAGERGAFNAALGFDLPDSAGRTVSAGTTSALWIGPDEWLVVAPVDAEAALFARLDAAVADRYAAATLVSDAYVVFQLRGAEVAAVLSQATGIDLHSSKFGPGRCARTAFAKTAAVIHRVDDLTYDVYVEASFRRYVRQWLAAARGR